MEGVTTTPDSTSASGTGLGTGTGSQPFDPLDNSLQDLVQESEEKFGISPSAFLYAVQEPCVFMQRAINIQGATMIMDPKAETVRAAIVCSTHLDIWPSPEFCSGDMVTCLLKTKKHGEIYVVSLYCDIELKPVPDMLKALQIRARKERKQLLILGDLNSHSSACWNSKDTNLRGKVWEKFISDKGLRVLNQGDKFTYISSTGQSIIDVTLATPGVAGLIKHWATLDYVPSSDHVLNEFMLLSDDCWTPRPSGFKLEECDWEKFETMVEEKLGPSIGNKYSVPTIDIEAEYIAGVLYSCMKECCPESGTITKISKIAWWNSKLERLQARLKTIRHYIRNWYYKRLNRDLPHNDSNKMK